MFYCDDCSCRLEPHEEPKGICEYCQWKRELENEENERAAARWLSQHALAQ